MLGNVAKKLRLLGYDARYESEINDEQLLYIAKKEKRIVISKDQELVNKMQKADAKFVLITEISEIKQCLQIMKSINSGKLEISGDKSRCPRCNSLTTRIKRKDIPDTIPKKVLEHNEKFWKCDYCKQVYWEGTHIKRLQKFTSDLNERL